MMGVYFCLLPSFPASGVQERVVSILFRCNFQVNYNLHTIAHSRLRAGANSA